MSDASTALAVIGMASADEARDAAERTECLVRMHGYVNDTATVQAARLYASCVYTIHGSGRPLSFTALLFLKAAFLLTVIGAIFGALKLRRQKQAIGMTVLGGTAGALGGATTAAVLTGLWFGFRFLFS